MITLKLNEGKRLKFSYAVASVHPENITGNFILDFDDSIIGFPIKIRDQKIVVEIKTLGRFIREDIGVIKARLEIVAKDTFLVPWRGQVKKSKEKKEVKEVKIKEEKVIIEDNHDAENEFSEFLNTPVEKLIEKKVKVEEEETVFSEFLDASLDDFIEKDEKKLEKEKVFSEFMDAPIEELIEGGKE